MNDVEDDFLINHENDTSRAGVFVELEREIYRSVKQKLQCKNCRKIGSMLSSGGGGAISAKGIRRLQLKCSFKKCSSKPMLHSLLQDQHFTEEYDTLNDAYKSLPRITSNHDDDDVDNDINIGNTNKRARLEVENTPYESEKEEDDIREGDNTLIIKEMLKKIELLTQQNNIIMEENKELKKRIRKIEINKPWGDICDEDILQEKIKELSNKVNELTKELLYLKNNRENSSFDNNSHANNSNNNTSYTKSQNLETQKKSAKNNVPMKPSYAEKVKLPGKPPANNNNNNNNKKRGEMAFSFIRSVNKDPQIFHRRYLRWNMSKEHKTSGRKNAIKLAYSLLNFLGIRNKVKEISLIGKSMIELYIAEICLKDVEKVCADNDIKLEIHDNRNANPYNTISAEEIGDRIINRLGYLLYRNPLNNVRECILQGLASNMKSACLEKEKEIGINFAKNTNLPSSNNHDDNGNNTTTNNNNANHGHTSNTVSTSGTDDAESITSQDSMREL